MATHTPLPPPAPRLQTPLRAASLSRTHRHTAGLSFLDDGKPRNYAHQPTFADKKTVRIIFFRYWTMCTAGLDRNISGFVKAGAQSKLKCDLHGDDLSVLVL